MKNILIADDDAVLLVVLAEALCSMGHWCNVMTARSGAEALSILETVPVDFVLTDLDMPEVDGYELLRHLGQRHPTVPVLVMTGAEGVETEKKLREAGIGQYVIKPLNLRLLAAEVADRVMSGPDAGRNCREGVFPRMTPAAPDGARQRGFRGSTRLHSGGTRRGGAPASGGT